MQHKILKFCREILNDALDRELVQKNVAKARFLSKNFKKSRPLIDPLMEEDAARFLHEVKAAFPCRLSRWRASPFSPAGCAPRKHSL